MTDKTEAKKKRRLIRLSALLRPNTKISGILRLEQ